jgi:RimJ/RimL family protein N-acetyltransferase
LVALSIPGPITLKGKIVRLEPLSEAHVPGLTAVGIDQDIWRYMLYGEIQGEGDMLCWVRGLLELAAQGTDIPFVVIHLASGRVAGATRYLEIRPAQRGLEIGGTWYGAEFQRTAVNTECKFLLLKHAFEEMGCVRVQFKTDVRNVRSQRAIERIGAVKEGILRNHMILPDGRLRDSVFYSVLNSEWPAVKLKLLQKMSR